MILVVAKNYRQFLDYCRERDLNPNSSKEVRYATAWGLYGINLSGTEVVEYGEAYNNPDYMSIMQRLAVLRSMQI